MCAAERAAGLQLEWQLEAHCWHQGDLSQYAWIHHGFRGENGEVDVLIEAENEELFRSIIDLI